MPPSSAPSSPPAHILVVGATGKQGSAVLEALERHPALQQRPSKLFALTRNPDSPRAKPLKARGIKVVQGDIFDTDSLVTALRHNAITAAFLVTDAFAKGGPDGERQQGIAFIDAAKRGGVEYIVFSSVGCADTATQVPHFASKNDIEHHLRDSGIPWAILRPAAFMDNFPPSGIGRFLAFSLFGSLLGGRRKLQYVGVCDIGRVAAECLLKPSEFQGQTIELSGDELTVPDIQKAWYRGTGTWPWKMWLPGSLLLPFMPYDFKMMFKFFIKDGYRANIKNLRTRFPGLKDFETWSRDEVAAKAKKQD
ncbi:uncharacterized protein PFL1_02183 [Pseudozyma flocculosa PF-1]|uniref:NmrA-like domain-containing protein n=1 Tax=Pseudozyma flocculosa TaxID=84751 RepID=A0A5C3FAB8_9BASI|nr:uncharacterized protein PFL1_02183 [Pseudozyma flocculosa PF-1]EPQ30066.1 hypothetical protein PFL1_02183 [Pseudozyma flocculosa PF-1]SPO41408.1 uncharacterized protein PSFLO_06890 [Pseudozyma flocculosa]